MFQKVLRCSCNLGRVYHQYKPYRSCNSYLSSFGAQNSPKNMTNNEKYQHRKDYHGVMKGVLVENFGGTEELKIKYDLSLPVNGPERLNANQVLVKVMFAGVNPVDTYVRSGQYARLPSLPYIPGNDAAGYIEAVGNEVPKNAFPLGSRVFLTGAGKNSGCYAEYVTVDMQYVFPLDNRLSFAQGAGLGVPYFTAYKALVLKGKTKKNELVLIHGASGAVGTAAVQIAHSLGAIVYGTAGSEEGIDIVAKCGAQHVFNHHEKDYEEKMKKQTNGQGFDVIIENMANINLEKDMQMLNKNARIMVIGSRGAITINPRHLMAPEASIQGVALGSTSEKQYQEIGSSLVNGIDLGWVNPVINREYNLEETQEAHRNIINSKGAKGKLVIKI